MTLHESLISDPSKSSTSFSLLKKRKKRKELDKLIIGRQYRHIRTSSCQDFHKMNNVADATDLLSSTDDTTTLLNSADEGLEYVTNSINLQKSNFLVNIFTIIGFMIIAILFFVDKSKSDVWKGDEIRDLSQLRLQFDQLQAQVLSSKYLTSVGTLNQTLANHTQRMQSLEEKVNKLFKYLPNFQKEAENQEKLTKAIERIDELNNNGINIGDLFKSTTKRLIRLETFYDKLEKSFIWKWISNTTNSSEQIYNILFQPTNEQISTLPNNSTAVLLSLSQYKDFLQLKSMNKP